MLGKCAETIVTQLEHDKAGERTNGRGKNLQRVIGEVEVVQGAKALKVIGQ